MVSIHRLAALTAIAAVLDLSNAAASSLTWYNCAQYTLSIDAVAGGESTAECALVQAPLCHDGVCTRKTNATIDLFVKRYISDEKKQYNPNVIILQGGSGAASTRLEHIMANLNELLDGKINTYTMDHRGTGRSTKLDCVAVQAQASGSPNGVSVFLDEVAECAEELEAKYDGDLSPFSVTSAANDVKYFIANYLAGQETYVYGVGFGTLTVERLMHLNPVGVKGYILDGVMTTSGASATEGYYLSESDVMLDAVGKSFLKFCEDDKDNCGKYFPNTLATAFDEMFTKMETQGPDQGYYCSDTLQSYSADPLVDTSARSVLRDALSIMIQQPSLRHLIPVIVHRMNRCKWENTDSNVINYVVAATKPFKVMDEQEQWMTSELLRDLIVYSELWASPAPSQSQMDDRSKQIGFSNSPDLRRYCAFTKDETTSCDTYHSKYGKYAAAPISYKRDKYYNKAVSLPSDVSVLVLSGTLDPVTPHKYAETLYKVVDAKNKKLVAFDYAAHGQLWRNDTNCTLNILGSFVAAKGDLTELDSACAASTANTSFAINRQTLIQVVETDYEDGIDGAYNGEVYSYEYEKWLDSSPYKTPFIIVASVLGAVIISLVALCFRLRAARRRNAIPTTSPSTAEPLTNQA